MKTCTKCGVEKPLSEFGKLRRSKDGLNTRCRNCHNSNARSWAIAHPENCLKSSRKWREANHAAWYAANRDRLAARYAANPERYQARDWTGHLVQRLRKQGAKVQPRPTVDEARGILASLGDKCATCSGTGPFEVDHITPLRTAPELVFEPFNLQRLCVPCHKAKTADER